MNVTRDDELMAKAADLATEIAPARDLWPDIEAAIAEPLPRRSWFTPYLAQAAAVLLLVGGSSGITWYVMSDNEAPVQVVAPDLVFEQVSFARYELGPGFQDARARLSSKLDVELEKLSPETRTAVEENLEAIRVAIAEISTALEAEPDNVLLQELLLKTYQEELMLMRHVGGLTQDVMMRNNGARSDI